jgi:DNA-binding transcriptional LysR family regulator
MFAAHDLAALVAIADHGSVRRAAATLGRTQPAVSQAIQRLEEAVGFPLLDRSGYRVQLTERGETFVKRARVTVKQARDLRTFAGVLSSGVEARLRIGIHGAIPLASWMHLISDVAERFPDTALEIQLGEGNAPLRWLTTNEADLAILLSAGPTHAGVHSQLLGELDFVNVVRTDRLGANLQESLGSLPQILVADFEDPATGFGVAEGHRYWRVSDHRIKVAAIIAGSGWGSVPEVMVEAALREGRLSAIAHRGMGPRSRRPFYIYRQRDKPFGPVAGFIWDRCDDKSAHTRTDKQS